MKTIVIRDNTREILLVINNIAAIERENDLYYMILKVYTTGVTKKFVYDTYEEREEVYDKLKKAIEESEE